MHVGSGCLGAGTSATSSEYACMDMCMGLDGGVGPGGGWGAHSSIFGVVFWINDFGGWGMGFGEGGLGKGVWGRGFGEGGLGKGVWGRGFGEWGKGETN
jgi:hypothetical protein